MTARINTAVHDVAITFDELSGTAGRAEIIETSPPRSPVRNVELFLSGLSAEIGSRAQTALASGLPVEVRVLGFSGSWTVAETWPDARPDEVALHLTSAGPIMAGMLPVR